MFGLLTKLKEITAMLSTTNDALSILDVFVEHLQKFQPGEHSTTHRKMACRNFLDILQATGVPDTAQYLRQVDQGDEVAAMDLLRTHLSQHGTNPKIIDMN